MAWTEDRVAILTKLWAEGLSASQIAKELGEVTRNAAVPAPPPLEAKPMSNGEFATILTITDHMCKWPIGDPSKSEFRFCGRKTDPDEPYCVAHSRVAYQPSRRRGASSNTKALGPSPTSRKRLR